MSAAETNGCGAFPGVPDLGAWAAWYAKQGIPVFPVHSAHACLCSCNKAECEHPGKHPRTPHGFKDASTNLTVVAEWWRQWPDANIGMPTGAVTATLVLDIDPRNGGEESLGRLEAEHGRLPDTAKQKTGGGGWHLFFQDPGILVPKTLAPGIDLKAKGGYVVIAPSIHVSGGRYEWDGIAGRQALLDPAELPAWLLELISSASNNRRTGAIAGGEGWVTGERNSKLFSIAGTMRRRGMSRESIEAALLEENNRRCHPPLRKSEVQSIAESAASYKPAEEEKQTGSTAATTAFLRNADGVFYIDPDPAKEPVRICGFLEVAALTRDTRGDGWGRLLKWPDAEGRAHEWAMPMSLLSGDGNEYRARLLDGGLVISPGRRSRELLTTYIQGTFVEERALCVSQVGWHQDHFVLPGLTVGPQSADPVIFQTPHESEHLLDVAGTLEEWKENVGRFCSGNSRLILAVSCGFAGPLLELAGAESGGVHFVGVSSSGKSTALLAGGSVLGGGRQTGFVQSWRTTANGLEGTAELHNDLTLFLDELSQVDAHEAGEIAYLLANGSGKARMSRTLSTRKKLRWRLIFLSAGEITLSEHTQSAGKRLRSGAEVRLLNIEADAGSNLGLFENIHGAESPDDFAQQMKRAALRFYGSPLRAWLGLLTTHRAQVEKAMKHYQAAFLKQNVPAGASGEVSRAAQRFALIAAAGELATDAGITGWAVGAASEAAIRCFQSWIDHRGTAGSGDAEAVLDQVRRFLEMNGSSRFQVVHNPTRVGQADNPDEAQVVRDRAGFRRRNPETKETEYLILQETFKADVCAGHDYRRVCRALDKGGYLVREDLHYTIKPGRLPEMPNGIRVYCVRATILEDAKGGSTQNARFPGGERGDTGDAHYYQAHTPCPLPEGRLGTVGTTTGVCADDPHLPSFEIDSGEAVRSSEYTTSPLSPVSPLAKKPGVLRDEQIP